MGNTFNTGRLINGLFVDASGNVAIGTSSPLAKLHVYQNGVGTYSILRINNDNSTANFHIGVGGSAVPNSNLQNNAILWNVGNSAMVFGTNDTERFRIASTGVATFSSSVTAGARIQAQGSNGAGTSQGGFLINYNANANSRSWLINNDYNVFGDFAILQTTTQTGSTFNDAYLYINPSGKVGIGTVTPTATKISLGVGIGAKLMIYDNPSTGVYSGLGQDLAGGNSTDLFAHGVSDLGYITFGKLGANGTSYSEWMRISPSGNVGIGNSSPLQSLGRTLTVEGTGIFQSSSGGGNYNENLRLNRAANGYSSISMGGSYNSVSGTATGQWTLVAAPSNLSYKFYLEYAGTETFTVRTTGQILQNGIGLIQAVPIGPTATNLSYSGTINAQYTVGSASIPSTAQWLLADVFITANISDHQNFMITRFNFGAQKNWVDTRGNNPANEFGNLTQGDVCILTYNGESDGYTPNYGIWKTSVLIPSVGRNIWINNYGNSSSSGYLYFIVRGYSL